LGDQEAAKKGTAADRAEALFAKGYLCSQAVLIALAPNVGLTDERAARVAAPLGAGMARLGWTCGAITGAMIAMGLIEGHVSAADEITREDLFGHVRSLVERFREEHGATSCRELTGCDLLDPAARQAAMDAGVFTTRCPGFVRTAASFVEESLTEGLGHEDRGARTEA